MRSDSISGAGPGSPTSDTPLEGEARSAFMYDVDEDSDDETPPEPVWTEPEEVIKGKVGIVNIFLCNDKRRAITEDADGVVSMWDIVRCKKLKSWHPDAAIGSRAPAAPALLLSDETGVKSKNPLFQQVVAQENTLDFAGTWCSLDNKTGAITVHLEESRCFDCEAYWDEVVPEPIDESKEESRGETPGNHRPDAMLTKDTLPVNIGKWILAYLFQNFRAGCLYPSLPRPVQQHPTPSPALDSMEDDQSEISGAGGLDSNSVAGSSVAGEGLLLTRTGTDASAVSGTSPTPMAQRSTALSGSKASLSSSPSANILEATELHPQPSLSAAPTGGSGTAPPSPGGNSFMDKFKLHMRRRNGSNSDSKSPKKSIKSGEGTAEGPMDSEGHLAEPQHPSDVNYRDAPPLDIPADVPVIVSVEENTEASSFLDLYRGTVFSMGNLDEVERLKQVIPTWVYEFTVEGKANVKETQKMSFQLFAYPECGLPELPSGWVQLEQRFPQFVSSTAHQK